MPGNLHTNITSNRETGFKINEKINIPPIRDLECWYFCGKKEEIEIRECQYAIPALFYTTNGSSLIKPVLSIAFVLSLVF